MTNLAELDTILLSAAAAASVVRLSSCAQLVATGDSVASGDWPSMGVAAINLCLSFLELAPLPLPM